MHYILSECQWTLSEAVDVQWWCVHQKGTFYLITDRTGHPWSKYSKVPNKRPPPPPRLLVKKNHFDKHLSRLNSQTTHHILPECHMNAQWSSWCSMMMCTPKGDVLLDHCSNRSSTIEFDRATLSINRRVGGKIIIRIPKNKKILIFIFQSILFLGNCRIYYYYYYYYYLVL